MPHELVRRDGWLIVRGKLDETAQLAALANDPTIDGALDIDLGGVTYLNSLGVRDWVMFVRRLTARGVAVSLHDCADVFVYQMNMIPDVRGAATVRSFRAPFACEACGWDGTARVEAADVAGTHVPSPSCPSCGAPTQLAEYPSSYLLFLE